MVRLTRTNPTLTLANGFCGAGCILALMQFIASPIIGSLSDKVGRRPVILLSCLGLGLDFVFMALAPNLAWLFVGRIISAATSAPRSGIIWRVSLRSALPPWMRKMNAMRCCWRTRRQTTSGG